MKFLLKLTIKILMLLLGVVILIMVLQRCSFREAIEIADEAVTDFLNNSMEG